MNKTDKVLGAIMWFALGVFFGIMSSASYVPRLKGYGCQDSSGVLYANEEDEFPLCERIESNR